MQKHCLAQSVLAIHTPTGSKYSPSNEDGRFNMLNMRVGGPYKVTVTVGFQTQIYNEVYLELGKPLNLDAILKDESQQLSEVMVTGAKSKVLVVVGRVEIQ
jgi:hypothetical protein